MPVEIAEDKAMIEEDMVVIAEGREDTLEAWFAVSRFSVGGHDGRTATNANCCGG